VTLVIDLLFTVVFLALMHAYSPLLTGVVLGAIPCYVLLSVIVTPILRARLNERFTRGAENQAFLVESVTGVETLKAMAVEPQLQRRWEEQLAEYVRAAFRATSLSNIASQTAGFVNKVTVVLILWIGARLVIDGALSVGQLVAFNMLAARVSGPVLRLVQLWQDFQQAGISVQRLGDILNTPTEPSLRAERSALPRMQGRVTFEHVTFRYRPDAGEVLYDVTLDIPRGQVVGIVGRSGSGKSTLGKLIQRAWPGSSDVSGDGGLHRGARRRKLGAGHGPGSRGCACPGHRPLAGLAGKTRCPTAITARDAHAEIVAARDRLARGAAPPSSTTPPRLDAPPRREPTPRRAARRGRARAGAPARRGRPGTGRCSSPPARRR
jgi:ABC-type protease/lipase transport system fused ATPase/permease subunit